MPGHEARSSGRGWRSSGRHVRGRRPWRVLAILSVLLVGTLGVVLRTGLDGGRAQPAVTHLPPPAAGYFQTLPVGAWSRLPDDETCAARVHRSTWEPRPDNYGPNHTVPDPDAVHAALAARPRNSARSGGYAPRFDAWLLPRVTGGHTGTTDENIQWAACKWGLSDNMLRAVAVRESTWFQDERYGSGRCVPLYGCGDMVRTPTPATRVFCAGIGRHGYDYERDYGPGVCPKTFSLVGVMAWEDPSWGPMRGNQNGTFPFSRDSTAYALDYVGAFLRGCYEGWVPWLRNTGDHSYAPGDLDGCVAAWYSGDWRSPLALGYLDRVRAELANRTWLSAPFRYYTPPCSPTLGCARPR
jgi:hypothetical protein